jgi:hypothetical protein
MKMVRRRARIIRSTEKAVLLLLKSNRKTLFVPKSMCKLVNENTNSMTGLITKTYEFPEWILNKNKDESS